MLVNNDKGIALVTSLMFTMLALVITMSLMYLVTISTKTSGAFKRYHTVTDAAYGGADIMVKDLIKYSFGFPEYLAANPSSTFTAYLKDGYLTKLVSAQVNNCLYEKLTTPKRLWSAACSNVNGDIKNSFDVSYKLNSTTGSAFVVYSRVVDDMGYKLRVFRNNSSLTEHIAGNSDLSQLSLEGASVTEASPVIPPHYPYMYTVEVQAEHQTKGEKAKLIVQYAY